MSPLQAQAKVVAAVLGVAAVTAVAGAAYATSETNVLVIGYLRSLKIASSWLDPDPWTSTTLIPARTYGGGHMKAFTQKDITR